MKIGHALHAANSQDAESVKSLMCPATTDQGPMRDASANRHIEANTAACLLQLTGIDVNRSLQVARMDVAIGRIAGLRGAPREGPELTP